MKETQGSAIRIVKRQQNKFNREDSIESPTSMNNSSVYHTQHHHTKKEMPQSAIMQQLLGTSKSSNKMNRSVLTQQSTEAFLHGGSSIGQNNNAADYLNNPNTSVTQSQQIQAKNNEYANNQIIKRIKKATKVIQQAEMDVTNAQNQNKLSSKECDTLLKSHLESL